MGYFTFQFAGNDTQFGQYLSLYSGIVLDSGPFDVFIKPKVGLHLLSQCRSCIQIASLRDLISVLDDSVDLFLSFSYSLDLLLGEFIVFDRLGKSWPGFLLLFEYLGMKVCSSLHYTLYLYTAALDLGNFDEVVLERVLDL